MATEGAGRELNHCGPRQDELIMQAFNSQLPAAKPVLQADFCLRALLQRWQVTRVQYREKLLMSKTCDT